MVYKTLQMTCKPYECSVKVMDGLQNSTEVLEIVMMIYEIKLKQFLDKL